MQLDQSLRMDTAMNAIESKFENGYAVYSNRAVNAIVRKSEDKYAVYSNGAVSKMGQNQAERAVYSNGAVSKIDMGSGTFFRSKGCRSSGRLHDRDHRAEF